MATTSGFYSANDAYFPEANAWHPAGCVSAVRPEHHRGHPFHSAAVGGGCSGSRRGLPHNVLVLFVCKLDDSWK